MIYSRSEVCARKNSKQRTQGNPILVGCCKEKMGPKKVSVPHGNGEDVPSHHQEKSFHHYWGHICTVPDSELTNWKQSSEGTIKATQENCGVKKSFKWSKKLSQIKNELVSFRSWFCMCWNKQSVITPQFLLWWEKLTCSGFRKSSLSQISMVFQMSAWDMSCPVHIFQVSSSNSRRRKI